MRRRLRFPLLAAVSAIALAAAGCIPDLRGFALHFEPLYPDDQGPAAQALGTDACVVADVAVISVPGDVGFVGKWAAVGAATDPATTPAVITDDIGMICVCFEGPEDEHRVTCADRAGVRWTDTNPVRSDRPPERTGG